MIKAIFKKECMAYFNSAVAYVFMVIFLALASFFIFQFQQYYEARQASLEGFFIWHQWLFLFLVPAIGMGMWSEERRSKTIELLFTMPITLTQAILGKFLAGWFFLCIAILLTFPMVITTYYLGDPDTGSIVTGYIGSMLTAGAYLSVAMFSSVLSKNQVISFILAIVLIFFALFLSGFAPFTNMFSSVAPTWLVDTVAAFSVIPHLDRMAKGLIDFRDLLYFFSVMGFMIIATQVLLQQKATR